MFASNDARLNEPKVIKILVLGDPGTGKSSIIKRYVKGTFSTDTSTTVGVDFGLKSISAYNKGESPGRGGV